MSYQDDVRYTALNRAVLTVFLVAGLSACGTLGGGTSDSGIANAGDLPVSGTGAVNGPRADYPVVVGEPYSIAGVEYVPSDTLNYDHVGYVTMDQGAMGYSGGHHTLPIPSYVEVTSLDTGRTILVRLERRGPMSSNHLISLAPAALAQLGASAETPVRVRRVNPPEAERFALRAGEPASLRMETPQSLLTVLQRRLPADGGASLRAENAASSPVSAPQNSSIETIEIAASEVPSQTADPRPAHAEIAAAAPARVAAEAGPPALPPLDAATGAGGTVEPQTASNTGFAEAFSLPDTAEPVEVAASTSEPSAAPAPAADGNFIVQAAAFSTMERAERVANVLGGQITRSGRYFRVRTGPFATRGEAEASLANVRRAGYSDARIQTSG